jgi:hypothetical protein
MNAEGNPVGISEVKFADISMKVLLFAVLVLLPRGMRVRYSLKLEVCLTCLIA